MTLRSIELFAGAGGLATGVQQAGFSHELVSEWDPQACKTLRANLPRPDYVVECDIRGLGFAPWRGKIDLLAGGPPCQPFSLGGKHRGQLDPRDMFPEMIRAVREIQPKAVLIENVRGLLRPAFSTYFRYIELQLRFPDVVAHRHETWMSHLARLEQHETSGDDTGLRYHTVVRILNAADYGIPQRRHRVFIVGFRADLGIEWNFPAETHSEATLQYEQGVTGSYWDRHAVAVPPMLTNLNFEEIVRPTALPWRTVRDAIGDLPSPQPGGFDETGFAHILVPGARSYPGHTGSPWDEPAKTLKAGVHGVPGGENTLRLSDGAVRYFSVREAARIQTFPDTYKFTSSWTESMRQIGNAVPVELARQIAVSIRVALVGDVGVRNLA